MNLTLVISGLSPGGAERVISILANYWAEKGWKVTLITLDDQVSDFYSLHPRVKRLGLGLLEDSASLRKAIKNNLHRLRKLRQAIKNSSPDAVISFVDSANVLTILATLGLNLPVIVSERTEPRCHNPGNAWRWLRKLTYPYASAIVAQSESVCQWLGTLAGKNPTIMIIPNPLNPELLTDEIDLSEEPAVIINKRNQNLIMSMGRLSWEKGYDLLLRAFAEIAPAHPEWDLVIIGEGGERANLEQLADELGISSRVQLPGLITKPATLISQADLFVLSSHYEGFPNALLEAMACGKAVISFDCPSGPREVIRDGIDGFLVPPGDVKALTDAMKRLIEDECERSRLAIKAQEVKVRFSLEKVAAIWEELFEIKTST